LCFCAYTKTLYMGTRDGDKQNKTKNGKYTKQTNNQDISVTESKETKLEKVYGSYRRSMCMSECKSVYLHVLTFISASTTTQFGVGCRNPAGRQGGALLFEEILFQPEQRA